MLVIRYKITYKNQPNNWVTCCGKFHDIDAWKQFVKTQNHYNRIIQDATVVDEC